MKLTTRRRYLNKTIRLLENLLNMDAGFPQKEWDMLDNAMYLVGRVSTWERSDREKRKHD